MAFDEDLAARIRSALQTQAGVSEKKMFGGVAFLVHGNMCVGVHRDSMIVRLDAASSERALEERYTRVFDLTGRAVKGWIVVEAPGVRAVDDVRRWTRAALSYVTALPAK